MVSVALTNFDLSANILVASSAQPSAHPRKRNTNRAKPDEHGENASKAITTKEYTHLVPRTKRIRQEVLEGWEDASSTLLEQINFLLKNAKDDIVYTRRDARRAEHANAILLSATQRLERSLLHMKIPPTARPLHFNLDRLAERNEQVYREVVASRHSKLLLEEQIEMAQRLLEEDQKKLRQLEKNAQDWRGRWQSREKKQLHPLLRQPEDVEAVGDTADNIGLRVVSTPIDKPVLDTPDSDLVPLLEQLRRSLEAMQGNHTQVQGISEAMRDARAALDDVLFRHASARQYDGV
ncbi:CENP-Q, a CENPA-CAD centromere complex subunit-domain-containing protein [Dendryphion nanum]|uniref:CENP-Q, a CENPA-CAD centromere complex subunit-domain-containing protein n=1 Tax=Dendryphion nanum TaxID=256645 RepID=A0A9P9IJ90_9PLEO|nr:CENP-Q, a CENPA-CAD centromere complex subunit-domain-containing protein [Dendryphion nanum]